MTSLEKISDAETGQASRDADMDLLQPLQLLLAARRGVRLDPDFSEMDIPNDHNLNFSGKSGVKCKTKRSSWWAQLLVCFGYVNNVGRVFISFVFFIFVSDISREFGGRNVDSNLERKKTQLRWSNYRTGLIAAGILFTVFYISRKMANKFMASVTPAHLDPLSYQFRLTAAMDQRGWYYQEVATAQLAELERLWATNKGISEKFTIKGLRYPATDEWVYDINVVFDFDGDVRFHFPKTNAGSQVSHGVRLS